MRGAKLIVAEAEVIPRGCVRMIELCGDFKVLARPSIVFLHSNQKKRNVQGMSDQLVIHNAALLVRLMIRINRNSGCKIFESATVVTEGSSRLPASLEGVVTFWINLQCLGEVHRRLKRHKPTK